MIEDYKEYTGRSRFARDEETTTRLWDQQQLSGCPAAFQIAVCAFCL